MYSIKKPSVSHPQLPRNALGLTLRDYEGVASTLCAGCGHDSITAAIVQAMFEADIDAKTVMKLSGIGCSSKSTAYFLREAHGINAVHGRMAAIASGANVARHDMHCLGISGDGDSLSIGLGQLCHAMRRNINMLYLIENNGVYGLTKGQFSASADRQSKSRYGEVNPFTAIDVVDLALSMGATFIARGFSGNKQQLVPLLKAGLKHRGFSIIDIISPCVTFNDHRDSTKGYMYTRQNYLEVTEASFVPPRQEITADVASGDDLEVQMHDGSILKIHCLATGYRADDRELARAYLNRQQAVVTGVIYLNNKQHDFASLSELPDMPLADVPFTELCPGSQALIDLQKEYR